MLVLQRVLANRGPQEGAVSQSLRLLLHATRQECGRCSRGQREQGLVGQV